MAKHMVRVFQVLCNVLIDENVTSAKAEVPDTLLYEISALADMMLNQNIGRYYFANPAALSDTLIIIHLRKLIAIICFDTPIVTPFVAP
jgi:hypothetical protein